MGTDPFVAGGGVIEEMGEDTLEDNLVLALCGGSYLVEGMDIVRRCLGAGRFFSSFLVPNSLLPRYLNIEPENRPPYTMKDY